MNILQRKSFLTIHFLLLNVRLWRERSKEIVESVLNRDQKMIKELFHPMWLRYTRKLEFFGYQLLIPLLTLSFQVFDNYKEKSDQISYKQMIQDKKSLKMISYPSMLVALAGSVFSTTLVGFLSCYQDNALCAALNQSNFTMI